MGGYVHAPVASRSSGPENRFVLAGAKDRYEQDAHRVARHYRASASAAAAGTGRPHVGPAANSAIGATAAAPLSVRRTLDEPGTPLEPAERKHFEQHFGHDFSRVRTHTGPAAAQSAHEVGARAYTAGRDIVFGAGQYAPGTPAGRHVLAHELTHVIQQDDAAGGQTAVRVQRLSFSDVLEEGAALVGGPVARGIVHLEKGFIDDLTASVRESPQHVLEFFQNEVWEQIKAHWVRVVLVSAGLILAEEAVAALVAVPEPTLLTKVIAAILEIIIIAVLSYFAAVEVHGAYEEGRKWLATAKQAHGQPAMISDASRSFVRMVWHIVMAVLAVAGVRARLRGIAGRGAAGAAGGDASAASGESGAGGTTPGERQRHRNRSEQRHSVPGPSAGPARRASTAQGLGLRPRRHRPPARAGRSAGGQRATRTRAPARAGQRKGGHQAAGSGKGAARPGRGGGTVVRSTPS